MTRLQLEFTGDKAPVVCRFYAGDKISDGQALQGRTRRPGTKERFTVFFASYSRK
jgi:hypothetical protein